LLQKAVHDTDARNDYRGGLGKFGRRYLVLGNQVVARAH
jgi:hypothetical protein